MNKRTKQTQGFTIIEVVLVLAIAALIMLMVFIAWPALQRSQRDNARKNDAQVVGSAIATYRSNNSGVAPTVAQIQGYISNLAQYDKTTDLQAGTVGTAFSTAGKINITFAAKCDSANPGTTLAGTSRQAAVQVILETNGTAQPFCQDA